MFSVQWWEQYTFLFWTLSVTKTHTKPFQKSKSSFKKREKTSYATLIGMDIYRPVLLQIERNLYGTSQTSVLGSFCCSLQYPDLASTAIAVSFFYITFMLSKSWNTSRCIPEGCHSLTLFRISLVLLYCGFFSFIFLGYNICQFCFMGLFVYRKWKK